MVTAIVLKGFFRHTISSVHGLLSKLFSFFIFVCAYMHTACACVRAHTRVINIFYVCVCECAHIIPNSSLQRLPKCSRIPTLQYTCSRSVSHIYTHTQVCIHTHKYAQLFIHKCLDIKKPVCQCIKM